MTSVTATKGEGAYNSIGVGYSSFSYCGTVTIGGVVGAISTSPYTYIPSGRSGKFTINSSGDQVFFAPGNLQVVFTTANALPRTWQFAPTQYSYIGNATANTAVGNNVVTTAGTVDLFGWVGINSSLASFGINNNTTAEDYGNISGEALKDDDWGEVW